MLMMTPASATGAYKARPGNILMIGKASPGFADKAQFSEVGLMIISPSWW